MEEEEEEKRVRDLWSWHLALRSEKEHRLRELMLIKGTMT